MFPGTYDISLSAFSLVLTKQKHGKTSYFCTKDGTWFMFNEKGKEEEPLHFLAVYLNHLKEICKLVWEQMF